MIRLIDLEEHGSPKALAAALKSALETDGFIYIKNHGMETAARRTFEIAEEFFKTESQEEKKRCSDTLNKGYSEIGQEVLDPELYKEGDKKEAFNISAIDGSPSQQPFPKTLAAHLDELAAFRTACFEFGQRMLQAFAIALDVKEDFFTSQHDDKVFAPILRLLHYPSIPAGAQVNPNRAGAHSDYGSLTLLFQKSPGGEGLELLPDSERLATGKWRPVGVVDDAVLVNVGDALELWSGARFKSTMHRVVLPQPIPAEGIPERYSIAFFNQPVPNASLKSIVPLGEISEQDMERMKKKGVQPGVEVTSAEHLKARLDATYKMRNAALNAHPAPLTVRA